MRNFLAHTDLTNPEKYNEMINFRPDNVQLQAYNQQYGKIKDLCGFYVEFDGTEFTLTDDYANVLYIALANKKEQVFKLINSFDFQICSSLNEFDVIIRKEFKRKQR